MTRSLSLYARTRTRRSYPEANLQIAVVQHLRLRGTPGLIYFAPCNEGKRSVREAVWLKQKGMLPGIADLVIIARGQPVSFLELKARGGKQSPEQIAFEAYCAEVGARYAVVDNIDDALRVLEAWGFIRASFRRAEMRADERREA